LARPNRQVGKLAATFFPPPLKKHAKEKYPPRLLIVQAEAAPGGAVTYGVIDRHETRSVPGEEMGSVRPLGAKGG
jgi:hypothetical protein